MAIISEDEGDSGEKSEAPTGRRAAHARTQGMVGQSAEFSQVIGMIAAFYAICAIVPWMWNDIIIVLKGAFSSRYAHDPLTIPVLQSHFYGLLLLLLPKLLLLLFIAALFGAGTTLVQTKFNFSWTLVKPKLRMINPLNGMKRIFSLANFLNLAKQIAKLAIIGPIAYSAFFGFVPAFLYMMDIPTKDILPLTATMAASLFKSIMKWLFFIACLDLGWQKWRSYKRLKMSKQEVKDEKKATEGDEAARRRIIQIGLSRARERMMRNVPKADVVVTNPTHIAVALSYSADLGSAPRVVAKGKGHVAERIKEIARRHGVPIIERKPLARALFQTVEVDREIPYELFKAVAEILAYVYRLKGKNPLRNRLKRGTKPAPQGR